MTDLFDNDCYKINKILLISIGRWPYCSKAWNGPITFSCILILGTQVISKICGIATTYEDVHLFFDSLTPLMIDLVALVKISVHVVNMDKFRALLDHMREDWKTLTTEEDVRRMREYAERGKKSAKILMYLLYCAMTFFMVMPFVPQILRTANASDGRPLPHNVEYFVDIDLIYYPALVHGYLTILICVTIMIATDAMFIVLVHHACGMLSTIGYRLEHLMDDKRLTINLSPLPKDDKPYENVCVCIRRHIRVLRFTSVMESSYNICFFLHAGINVMILSVAGVHAVMNLDNPQTLFRQLAATYGQTFHLFFEIFQAQRLLNHSSRISQNLINSSWYLTSFRTRKLLNFMIMRTHTPCALTAGKMSIMSLQMFGTIVRSSMSYFTVLRSMQ